MFSMKNILIRFKSQLSKAKVNVKVAIPRNMLLANSYSNCRYGNIFDKFVFQHSRAKVKVTVAIRRKLLSLFWPSRL